MEDLLLRYSWLVPKNRDREAIVRTVRRETGRCSLRNCRSAAPAGTRMRENEEPTRAAAKESGDESAKSWDDD